MQRRDFLASLLAGATNAVSGQMASAGQARHRRARPAPSKLERVGISTWSFHNQFEATRDSSVDAPLLALLDFPEMVADHYKVHSLEFVAPHFPSLEPAYLDELRSSLHRARSRVINIPVDIREIQEAGGLSDPDATVRSAAIEASKKWIDIAKQLGARSVRCDPGAMNPDDLTLTISSYRHLAAYGRVRGIVVLIENHGAIGSEHPESLVTIFRAVGGPFLGALPDFGNFTDEAARMRGLPQLFPYARTVCHAKGLRLGADGNETAFDFGRCVAISKQAAYKGVYSIEYEGDGDPYSGVASVVNELMRYL
jgi:sugar phosphate isomerase/epimerase